jgi:hypothetical protein
MKTSLPFKLLAAAMLMLALAACENTYWSCLHGNGVIVTETRELEYFNGVVTEGDFELTYLADTVYYIELETDENLMPYIRTRLRGNTLVVDNGTHKCLRSEYPVRLTVHAPELVLMSLTGSGLISGEYISGEDLRIEITGSGTIDLSGVDVLSLQAIITGSGEVKLYGETDQSRLTITGSGSINAKNLLSQTCVAEISGSGNIYAWVETHLDAIISGSGTIFYKGSATVSTIISGSGSVLSIN